MRRGFKSEAERLAREVREERELPLTEAFDPFAYAAHLGIPVLSLADLEEHRAEFATRWPRWASQIVHLPGPPPRSFPCVRSTTTRSGRAIRGP